MNYYSCKQEYFDTSCLCPLSLANVAKLSCPKTKQKKGSKQALWREPVLNCRQEVCKGVELKLKVPDAQQTFPWLVAKNAFCGYFNEGVLSD